MSDDEKSYETIKSLYEKANQGHVLKHISTLTPTQRSSLLNQLSTIDVSTLAEKLSAATAASESSSSAEGSNSDNFEPFAGDVASTSSPSVASTYRPIGLSSLSRGEACAVLLSGGQGTRLGFDGPKGKYDLGLPSGSTLFRLVAERLVTLSRLASSSSMDDDDTDDTKRRQPARIPLYIMTSPMNHDETVSYFESEGYFGLNRDDVSFFPQGVLPCLSPAGEILMETPWRCAMAPDGNGGVYKAMEREGVIEDMRRRGVKYIHAFAIDNALVRPVDPVFLGYCIHSDADCGNKVLWKRDPREKVGVVAQKNGRPCVVEYSDLDPASMERTDPITGRLRFGAGNICNHFYTLEFLRGVVLPRSNAMYHVAKKKIPVYDETSRRTATPSVDNGIKLESFIFDVFPLSQRMAVLDVRREDEFAPVKNAPGTETDSPDVARRMISDLAKRWVRDTGRVTLLGGEEDQGGDESISEVRALTSYAGEGLDHLPETLSCPFLV